MQPEGHRCAEQRRGVAYGWRSLKAEAMGAGEGIWSARGVTPVPLGGPRAAMWRDPWEVAACCDQTDSGRLARGASSLH